MRYLACDLARGCQHVTSIKVENFDILFFDFDTFLFWASSINSKKNIDRNDFYFYAFWLDKSQSFLSSSRSSCIALSTCRYFVDEFCEGNLITVSVVRCIDKCCAASVSLRKPAIDVRCVAW